MLRLWLAARERFLVEFPFDPAFLEGTPKGLPKTGGRIESPADVLSCARRRELAVAYLEGLGALACVGEERSRVLNVLAEEAVDKAVAADVGEWGSFVKAARAALQWWGGLPPLGAQLPIERDWLGPWIYFMDFQKACLVRSVLYVGRPICNARSLPLSLIREQSSADVLSSRARHSAVLS